MRQGLLHRLVQRFGQQAQLAVCAAGVALGVRAAAVPALPENRASAATVSTDSTYSADYAAAYVADGQVPAELSDRNTALDGSVSVTVTFSAFDGPLLRAVIT